MRVRILARRSPAGSSRLVLAAALLGGFVILAGGALLSLTFREQLSGGVFSSAIGGPFRLIDQNGQTLTDGDLKGKSLLVYFGYTHCPDACPTALNDIALALDALGPERNEVRPVFITVDPERDTPEVLKDHVASFDAPIIALTGTEKAVAQAAKSYRVYYAKHRLPGGGYEMDHSSVIYVMNRDGHFVASLTHENSPEQIAQRLKKLSSDRD